MSWYIRLIHEYKNTEYQLLITVFSPDSYSNLENTSRYAKPRILICQAFTLDLADFDSHMRDW